MRMLTPIASFMVALTLLACSKPFSVATPSGFLELEHQDDKGYAYRATHPDGLVMAVRVIRNDPAGDLSFWARAIENQLRQGKGYRLVEQSGIKSNDGAAGTLLKFGHDEGSKPHLYRIALYVKDTKLFILEMGGAKELVSMHEKDLEQFVAGFVIK